MMKEYLRNICILILSSGCHFSDPRHVSIDALCDTFEKDYVYLEVRDDLRDFRRIGYQLVDASTTQREYLVSLAKILAILDDPHISLNNMDEYWMAKSGNALVPACSDLAIEGGFFWVGFSSENIVPYPGQPLPPQQELYQLISVENIPVSVLAVQMLRGESRSEIPVSIAAADGKEYAFKVKVPPASPTTQSVRSELTTKVDNIQAFAPTTQEALALDGIIKLRIGEIGFISIESLKGEETVKAFDSALNELMDTKALVLDLRRNPGGMLEYATKIMGRFVNGIRPFALIQARLRGRLLDGEFPIWYSYPLLVGSRRPIYYKPIVVLIGSQTASMAELLAASLHDIRSAVLVGHRTLGAGATVSRVTLPDGLTVQYSSLPLRRLDGRAHQYVGIAPDVDVPIDHGNVCKTGRAAINQYNTQTLRKGVETAIGLAEKW